MIILTNDPSIGGWGWAVIKLSSMGTEIIESGCIKTESEAKKRRIRKSDDLIRRLDEINHTLLEVIEKHKVEWFLCEAPHGSQNAAGAKMIGAVTGVMSALAASLEIPVEWYSEGDAKKHLLNKRSASKQETIDCIIKEYGDGWVTNVKYKDEAVADALAVYHVGRESPALRYAANQNE